MDLDVKPDDKDDLAAIQREKLREILKRVDNPASCQDEILGYDEHGVPR